MSIGIYIPTLGRPHALQRVVANIYKATTLAFTIVFSVEAHDEDSLRAAEETGEYVVVNQEAPSYSNAYQAAYAFAGDAFVLNGNDDFHFEAGWDTAAVSAMTSSVHVVGVNDGYQGTDAILLCRRSYVEDPGSVVDMPGRVFFPYAHNYVDTEMRETAQARGCYAACSDSVIRHAHPDFDAATLDDTYRKSRASMPTDADVFASRRHLWSNL